MRPRIEITVKEAGTPAARALALRIIVDGELLDDRTLSPLKSQEAQEISRQYASLFEKGCRADRAKDYLEILGSGLSHLFFEKAAQAITCRLSKEASLVVSSEIPEVLQLPWELLPWLGGASGTEMRFEIRRHPRATDLPAFTGQLPDGPLQVLFMACDPTDYEEVERSILQVAEGLDMALEVSESGAWEELSGRLEILRPHLVHLDGQVKMKDGEARFSFEGQGSRPDLRSSEELGQVLARSGAQCLLLSGCQNENPTALNQFCQGLAGFVPMAVGWNASADFARAFYSPLAGGLSIDWALSQARGEVFKECRVQGKIHAIPVLYSNTFQDRVFDALRRASVAASREEQQPLLGLAEGYAEGFVGRRRDLQRLDAALREGAARSVIVTGLDGMGKSALATSLARNLASEGYLLLPVYSSSHNPLSATRVLETAIGVLGKSLPSEAQRLKNPRVTARERLNSMLDILNKGRCLLVMDGLSLDEEGKIRDPDLAEFYVQMLQGLGRGRAIITCKRLPADAMTLPKDAWEWPLGPVLESSFVKFLLQDPSLAERYRKGELSYAELQKDYAKSAGLPDCLAPMRAALRNSLDFEGCHEATRRLVGLLSLDLQRALRHAAVYEVAVNAAALAAASKLPEEMAVKLAKECQAISLARRIGELWAFSSSLGRWLSRDEELSREAHLKAGEFLRDLSEAGRSSEIGLSRLDGLLEARGHLLASGDVEKARQVTGRISGYLEIRGYYREVIRLNQEVLQKEKHIQPMKWIAQAYLDQEEYAMAEEWYQRALELEADAAAFSGLATARLRQGRHDLAKDGFQKAAKICSAAGDLKGEAAALQGLSSIDMEQKNDQAALEKLQRILEIQKALADLRGEAATLHDMATLYLRRGDGEAARQKFVESLEILEHAGDKAAQASALFNLASIDLEKGDLSQAQREFAQALTLKRELGDRSGEAAILHSLGSVEAQAGDKEKAGESFQKALEIFQELGDKPGEAGAFFQLGAVAAQQNKIEEGLRLMALSAIILRGLKSQDVKSVEPLVEKLASQLNYTQTQFMDMVQKVASSYRKDRGWGLVELALMRAGSLERHS